MKSKFLLFLLPVLGWVSCEKYGGPRGPKLYVLDSYISLFVDSDGVYAEARSGFYVDEENKLISAGADAVHADKVYSAGDGILFQITLGRTGISDDKFDPRRELYLQTIDEIGDHGYNKEVYDFVKPVAASAIIVPVKTLRITADKAYDATHPAGTNLADYFTVFYDDAYSFVQNGYQPLAGTYDRVTKDDVPHFFRKSPLAGVDLSQKPYIGDLLYCHLTTNPAAADTFTFTISVTFANDETYTSTTKPVNLNAE